MSCIQHPEKESSLYSVQGKKLVCQECPEAKNGVDISEAVLQEKENFRLSSNLVSPIEAKLQQQEASIAAGLEKSKQTYEGNKEALQNFFAQFRQNLDRSEQEIVAFTEEQHQKQVSRLLMQQEQLITQQNDLLSFKSFQENVDLPDQEWLSQVKCQYNHLQTLVAYLAADLPKGKDAVFEKGAIFEQISTKIKQKMGLAKPAQGTMRKTAVRPKTSAGRQTLTQTKSAVNLHAPKEEEKKEEQEEETEEQRFKREEDEKVKAEKEKEKERERQRILAMVFKEGELSQLMGLTIPPPARGARKAVPATPKKKGAPEDILKSAVTLQQLKTMNFIVKPNKQEKAQTRKTGGNTTGGFNATAKSPLPQKSHRKTPSNVSTLNLTTKEEPKKTLRKEPLKTSKKTVETPKPRTPVGRKQPTLFKSNNKEESKQIQEQKSIDRKNRQAKVEKTAEKEKEQKDKEEREREEMEKEERDREEKEKEEREKEEKEVKEEQMEAVTQLVETQQQQVKEEMKDWNGLEQSQQVEQVPAKQMNALLSMKESEEMDVHQYFEGIKDKALEEFKNSNLIEEQEEKEKQDSLEAIEQQESLDAEEGEILKESNVEALLCSELDQQMEAPQQQPEVDFSQSMAIRE